MTKGVGSLFHVGGDRLLTMSRTAADMKKTPDPVPFLRSQQPIG
jgi:hypothetical protein